MNEVHLVGRAGKEPEVRYTEGEGKAVATVSIAVKARGDKPHWFNLTVWEKTAEILVKYVHKGHYLAVKGRIKQDKWVDGDGEERVGMTIVVEKLTLCNSKSSESEQSDYDDAF